MGRGKGALRKESTHDVGMVGRRSYMEHLHPLPSTPQKRPSDRSAPRPAKRPRSAPAQGAPPPPPNFLYAPNRHIDVDKLLVNGVSSRVVVVHIYADYLTSANPAVRNRLLWGSDAYTEDSDVVAILLHTGFFPLPATRSSDLDFLSVRLNVDRHVRRVSPPFASSLRNGLRSRAWSEVYDGGRLSVLSVALFKNERSTEMKPHIKPSPLKLPRILATSNRTVATTGSAKGVPKTAELDSFVTFDMANRPCLLYDIKNVSDIGNDDNDCTLTRLRNDVLYVENDKERFEVCLVGEGKHRVRFGRIKRDAIVRDMLAESGFGDALRVPLRETDVDVLHELPWKALFWDLQGVSISGKHYALTKMSFRAKSD